MAKITAVMTDKDKAEKGAWIRYAEDIELCIASISNPAYRDMRARLLKPHLRQIRSKSLTAEEVLDIIKPAAARHLLLDWRNIEDDTGTPIEYSYEQAMKFFNDPALNDLYMFVIETAGENELYRMEDREDAAKNS